MGYRVDWQGSFPAICTPFTKDGALDEKAIRANVRMTVDEGAHGMVICGHNGEAHLMSDDERTRVTAWACEEVNGRIPVIAGTGHINTNDVIALTKAAKSVGANGAMVEAPYFMTPKKPDILTHYQRISDACDLPIKVYNNPSRAGCDITPEMLVTLAERANIASIKDSMGNYERIMQLIQAVGDRLRVFIGPARLFGFAGVTMGAHGFVDGLPQIAGRAATRLYELAAARNDAEGVPLQHRLFRLGHVMFHSAGTPPSTTKDAMRILGRPGGWPRAPLQAMEGQDLRKLEDALKSLSLVKGMAAE
ncbi:MAG: dihydrodipicolinate synthase family protein [Proteobacteria bacterium]|nr:dihydrodipicolinate synthase family protein [Pseudomonadota bacterium]